MSPEIGLNSRHLPTELKVPSLKLGLEKVLSVKNEGEERIWLNILCPNFAEAVNLKNLF